MDEDASRKAAKIQAAAEMTATTKATNVMEAVESALSKASARKAAAGLVASQEAAAGESFSEKAAASKASIVFTGDSQAFLDSVFDAEDDNELFWDNFKEAFVEDPRDPGVKLVSRSTPQQ